MAGYMDWALSGATALFSSAPGNPAPYSIRVEVNEDLVQTACNTGNFDVEGLLVIRRDNTFPIRLDTRSKLQPGSISATLVYEEGKNEVSLQIVKEESEYSGSTIEVYACSYELQ